MPNQNFRGGAQGIRGGFQPGRPHANKKEALKFEKDYDANEHNSEEEGEIVDEAGERKTPSTDAHQS